MNPQHQQKRKIRQSCCHKFYPPTAFHCIFQLLSQTVHVCFHGRRRAHTRPCSKDRTQRHTRRNTGRFGWGRYYYPRSVPHVSETLRGRGLKRQTLPLLGLGREVLSKNAESLRDSDALMRVAVPRRRGPVWLRDPVSALLKFSSSNINGFGAPINIENLIFSLSLRRQNCSHF